MSEENIVTVISQGREVKVNIKDVKGIKRYGVVSGELLMRAGDDIPVDDITEVRTLIQAKNPKFKRIN